jgi:spermidine synthase
VLQRWQLPILLLLSFGSGAAALIYEIVWFQLLELVIGSTAVSLGVILATFMGGMCLGSLVFPRLALARRNPLRVYAAIELGIGAIGILALLLIPSAGSVYTAWSGYGLRGFLWRGMVAGACLLPPTVLMGATLPALSRTVGKAANGVSGLGFLYGTNIAGAVSGCVAAGFYLLREYDVATATYAACSVNVLVAGIALVLGVVRPHQPLTPVTQNNSAKPGSPGNSVHAAIALSGLCALAGEAVWTRTLGLQFGASVYALSIILAVFLTGLGIGSGIGSLLGCTVARPRLARGWWPFVLAGALARCSYTMTA